MTNEKAREFFSSYHEGSLDSGLRQTFEQKLRSDRVLSADYAAFSETMSEMDSLKFEVIEVPSNLSDNISTRIEEVQSKERKSGFSWVDLLRGSAVTAVLAAGAFIVWQGTTRDSGPNHAVAMGGVIPSSSVDSDQLKFTYADGTVTLSYHPTTATTIVVSSGSTGQEIQRIQLDGRDLKSPLKNDLAGTAMFDVRVEGETSSSIIAVPGTSAGAKKSSTGTVKEFAAALAGFYRTPVLVEASNVTVPTTWNFDRADAREEANETLSNLGFSVDSRPSGMIVIMDR